MITLASIIHEFRDLFEQRYQNVLLPGHAKALSAMARCRQEHGPHMLARCGEHNCGHKVYIPHSCGHRICPHCQNHESGQWIDNQLRKRLPAQYFLVTFTLPEQLRDLAWHRQKTVYSLMFTCVRDVLQTFIANDRKLGGTGGFTAVLHTSTRALDYHPHIHVLVPGGSVNRTTGLWRTKPGYLFSHQAMAQVFRAKLLQAMVASGLIIPADCPKQWVVDCRDVGNGEKAIIYLGRYLYRGVIREQDILRCENGTVTFRYLHAKTNTYRTRTVRGEYFLYLIMLHVLPRGFRRTRCYGFLHHRSKRLIQFLQVVLRIRPHRFSNAKQKQRPGIRCPVCGAAMAIVRTMISRPPARLQACPT